MDIEEQKQLLEALLEGRLKPGSEDWHRIWEEDECDEIRMKLLECSLLDKEAWKADKDKIHDVVSACRKRGENRRRMSVCQRWVAVAALFICAAGFFWIGRYFMKDESVSLSSDYQGDVDREKVYLFSQYEHPIDISEIFGDTIWQTTGAKVYVQSGEMIFTEDMGNSPEGHHTEDYHTLVVPRKGEYKLVLSDGSSVHLNSESELQFPAVFSGDQRRVILQGEAFFSVAEDKERPFIVETRSVDVRVLGTEFNLNSYKEEKVIRTTLISGEVEVTDRTNGKKVVVSPGQQAEWQEGSLDVKQVDTSLYTSWREGQFFFVGLSLEKIMCQLQRWYDIDVYFADDKLREYHFAGVVDKRYSIEKILHIIEETTHLKISLEGKQVTIAGES